MLDLLSRLIGSDWGPARLLSSYLFLASCGVMASILTTLLALPRRPVLLRFTLMHVVISALLAGLLLKVR